MKNIYKLLTLSLIVIAAIAFTGCAELNINAEITPENLVTYSYTLDFTDLDEDEPNYTELQLFLLDIAEHWENNGVEADIATSPTAMSLTGVMQKQCASRYEAFNTLYEFMTNEISLFDNVSLDYNEDYYTANYALIADIDLTGIVDEQIYEVHPSIVDNDVDEFIQNMKCNAIFSLPANDSLEVMEINSVVSSYDIPFNVPYSIAIIGTVTDNLKAAVENALHAKQNRLRATMIIAGAVALAALVGIVVLVLISKKKSKDSESKEIAEETLAKQDEE